MIISNSACPKVPTFNSILGLDFSDFLTDESKYEENDDISEIAKHEIKHEFVIKDGINKDYNTDLYENKELVESVQTGDAEQELHLGKDLSLVKDNPNKTQIHNASTIVSPPYNDIRDNFEEIKRRIKDKEENKRKQKYQTLKNKQIKVFSSARCKICAFLADSKESIRSHKNLEHREYICYMCEENVNHTGQCRVKRAEVIFKGRFPCYQPDCLYKTNFTHNLQVHLETYGHGDGRVLRFNCYLCADNVEHRECKQKQCRSCAADIVHKKCSINRKDNSSTGPKKFKCGECKYENDSRGNLKQHINHNHMGFDAQITGKQQNVLSCRICDETIKHGSLNTHFKSAHPNEKTSKCSSCEYSSNHQTNMKKHISNKICLHGEKYTYTKSEIDIHLKKYLLCYKCSYKTPTKGRLLLHLQNTGHGDDRMLRYDCSLCADQVEHLVCKNMKCRLCVSESPHLNCLLKNKNKTNTGEGKIELKMKPEYAYSCRICSVKVKRADILSHFESNHPNEQAYVCSNCEYSSNYSWNMKSHKATVHDNVVFECKPCVKSFKWQIQLSNHNRNFHKIFLRNSTATHSHICPYCRINKTSKLRLKIHIRKQHTSETERVFGTLSEDVEAKLHKCDECSYSSNAKGNLYAHRRKHNKDRLLKCDECSYASNYKGNLNTHKKSKHGKEELLSCPNCSYETKLQVNLRAHIKYVHTLGVNSQKCTSCKFVTTYPTNLSAHKILKNH